MSNGTTYRIPESVVADTLAYRREVERFLAGDATPVAFRGLRVPLGIYEQRENDTYMVRVRGAAGVFLPHQAKRIAELSREFGDGVVHATTRQDLQIHRLHVEDTPTVLERLLDAGLSSRGGGGNTVRNVTACAAAGVCPDEAFDVTPYALALTEYLVTNRANFNLPRKFKAAFSGCGQDCSLVAVADLGFFARLRDGERGFAVYAAGGMGAHSALSIPIEEFVPEAGIFAVAEAVKRLFDTHGDRANRSRARLRFVVERVGADEFRRLYREELARVQAEGIQFPSLSEWAPTPAPASVALASEPEDPEYRAWRAANVLAQKQAGLFRVRLPLPLGQIAAHQLDALADLAAVAGDGSLRATQDQELQLRGVEEARLPGLYARLKEIGIGLVGTSAVRCVACAGASTCRLGMCLSRGLAQAVQVALAGEGDGMRAPIRISGCPNACGQHPIAPIGLYGGAQRVGGRLVPTYWLMVGGRVGEGVAALSHSVGKVPARAVPDLLAEFWAAAAAERRAGESDADLLDRWGADALRALAAHHAAVPSYDEAPEFYRDWGSNEEFSLAGRGPGECGAGVTDVIVLDIDTAKQALARGALYEAVLAAARALLVTRGLEPKRDREVFAAFSEHLIAPRWVSPRTQAVLDAAVDLKLGDRESLDDLRPAIEELVGRVDELFRSLDSGLQFRVPPVEGDEGRGTRDGSGQSTSSLSSQHATRNTPGPDPSPVPRPPSPVLADAELDLRGVACPMNFVHAKIQLEAQNVGDLLDILLDGGEPVRNVPASLAEQGQEVLSVSQEGDHFRVRVRKEK